MSETEKQTQVDEMWGDYLNESWWLLSDYYHKAYRGVSWPPGARAEVAAAKAAAEADPRTGG